MVEEKDSENDWQLSYHLSRLKGLSPQVKSFNFRLLHRILPCKELFSQLLPASSPTCTLCQAQLPDSLLHTFFDCEKNREASQYLLHLTRVYDSRVSCERVIKLQINTEVLYEVPTILLLCTGLNLIWRNRQQKSQPVYTRQGLSWSV